MARSLSIPSVESLDPLALAIAPPKNESLAEREARELTELLAKKISDEIDEQIRKDRERFKKRKKPVKVLLLGQSESGKSATLKNFQLTYARHEWSEERASWRSVIQLNLVRNVNEIMDVIGKELSASPQLSQSTELPEEDDETMDDDNVDNLDVGSSSKGKGKAPATPMRATYPPTISGAIAESSSSASASGSGSGSSNNHHNNTNNDHRTNGNDTTNASKLTERHRLLRMRLGPLRQVQAELERKLGSGATEMTVSSTDSAAPFESFNSTNQVTPKHSREFSINSHNGFKYALDKFRMPTATRLRGDSRNNKGKGIVDEITDVIAQSREDMKSVWEDPIVRKLLSQRKTRIEESAGFFLTEVDRIAVPNYQPTDDDVIRARLRTIGVSEYRFVFESGRAVGQEWLMYDVGGTRSSRAAWYPYFDVDAIIFLAPISSFDEKLVEDRRVNRLEDTYLLWRSVCSCKLLAKTHIVLFLNKCDLLQAKLMRGIRIRDHVPSYADRRNELGTATKYFQQHFKEISKQASPAPRPFYVHLTSVIDVRSTAVTLGAVEESILRDHLRKADLM